MQYRYHEPVKSAVQHLRLTPRNYDGHHVKNWRIDIDRDCRLLSSEDAFGNIVHRFTADGPFESITIMIEGEVTTFDTAGVASGALERFPPALYLRQTPLTAPSPAIVDFARSATAGDKKTLGALHSLLSAIHGELMCDAETSDAAMTATEALERGKGGPRDFAHLFIAAARAVGAPARYVSGYHLCRGMEDSARHSWAEAYVEGLGWVGFDPAHGVSPGERHVRLAVALDHLSAAPIRSAHVGGAGGTMEVKIRIAPTPPQSQSQ